MNKAILNNLLEKNRPTMVASSLVNCHARGVDSIMVYDKPGMGIRLFVANKNHELWKNKLTGSWRDKKFARPMSVAFHPHHCNITLRVIFGNMTNVTVKKRGMRGTKPPPHQTYSRSTIELAEFEYQTPIGSGQKGSFYRNHPVWVEAWSIGEKRLGDAFRDKELKMNADCIHSVHVAKGKECAWFVFEGASDKNYKPLCYSNDELENFDWNGMYQKMDEPTLDRTIDRILTQAT